MYVYIYIYKLGDINYQKWWTMREVPWRKEAKAPYLCVFVAVFNEWIFISAERWYMQLWVWFTRMAREALCDVGSSYSTIRHLGWVVRAGLPAFRTIVRKQRISAFCRYQRAQQAEWRQEVMDMYLQRPGYETTGLHRWLYNLHTRW